MLTSGKPRYPVPEAIQRKGVEGAFEIEDGYKSATDLGKAKMVVPTGAECRECGDDHARAARLREMGRTAWTPADWETRVKRTKDKLPIGLVGSCEIGRLNSKTRYAGVEIPPIMCSADNDAYFVMKQIIRSGDMLTLAGFFVESFRNGDETVVKDTLVQIVGEMKNKTDPTEAIKADGITELYTNVMAHARWHFEGYRKPTFRYSISLARDIIRISEGVATAMEKKLEEMREAERATKVRVKEYQRKKPKPEDVRFGKMSIVELPLPYRSSAGFERKWTARDEGPIPTRFDRWSIDKRIFRTKKRGKGAALLVDVSGSMAWSEEHLAQVLDEVPAATIAIYSGSYDEGKLVIVARKGRAASMITAARFMMGGNVIDGPALEWLAEQPETTKLWMSDGGITGLNDGWSGDKGLEYCGNILRKGGIQQVRNAKEVLEVLEGKKSFIPSKKVNQGYWS